MDTVRVCKVKRPSGGTHWSAYVVGEDEFGLWVHSPKDSLHHKLGEGRPWTAPYDGVQLIPRGAGEAWWVGWWWADPKRCWYAVDICAPAVFSDAAGWSYVDLELDLVGDEGGFGRLVDEDEFERAVERGWIPGSDAAPARAAAGDVEVMMRSFVEPFGRVGWDWLSHASSLTLPPILVAPSIRGGAA